jgi:hypothetical protein
MQAPTFFVPLTNEFNLIVLRRKQLKCKEYDDKCIFATGWYRNAIRRTYIMKRELFCGVFDGMQYCGKLHQHLGHAAIADTF